jgi:hypothetical protein
LNISYKKYKIFLKMATSKKTIVTPTVCQVLGLVKSISHTTTPSIFVILTDIGYMQCVCPFFKPLEVDDFVFGKVKIISSGVCEFISPPYVQIPQDEGNIKKCFIIALRTSGFGGVKANRLYDEIKDLINTGNIIKGVPSLSMLMSGKEDKAMPSIQDVTPMKVVKYLNDASLDWYQNRNDLAAKAITIDGVLNEDKAKSFLAWWYKKRYMRRLYLLGITNKEIKLCYMTPDEIYKICVGDPDDPSDKGNAFRLPAIPLEKAVGIFVMLGMPYNPIQLMCGKIVRCIYENAESRGWTCTPLWFLQRVFSTYHTIKELLESEYFVIFECKSAYLEYQHIVENTIVKMTDDLIKSTASILKKVSDVPEMEGLLSLNKKLTSEQLDAIQGALDHPISVITGGPGTGKTSICKEIITNLELREVPYIIGAFTGKAVSRLHESLGSKKARTIDRIISRAPTILKFVHIIIDEASMVTTELMYRLYKALPKGFKLTVVGDIDQLSPISWGTFMAQIMSCGRVPTYRLTKNFRVRPNHVTLKEKADSKDEDFTSIIVKNANNLIDKKRKMGEPYIFENGSGFNVFEGNLKTIEHTIKELHKAKIPKESVTIISPYNEFIDPINSMFEYIYLNGNNARCDCDRKLWVVGCRVMMTTNNYEIGVMNGEEGVIMDVSSVGVIVSFDEDVTSHTFKYSTGGKKKYKGTYQSQTKVGEALTEEDIDVKDLYTDSLAKSFAITVHKSQGSEQEYVIIYIPDRINERGTISKFLSINLLYTAITRTKSQCYVIGSTAVLSQITCNVPSSRHENLGIKLKEKAIPDAEDKLMELITSLQDKYNKSMGYTEKVVQAFHDEFDEEEEGDFYIDPSMYGL